MLVVGVCWLFVCLCLLYDVYCRCVLLGGGWWFVGGCCVLVCVDVGCALCGVCCMMFVV